MCARFVSRIMAAMERVVQVRWHDPFELLYNAAPSMQLSVVTAGEDAPEVRAMKWGFIPGWWTQARPPKLTINTRSEEAPDKPMWRAAFRGARCLVPALGWYEWSTESRVDTRTGEIHEVRQPNFVHLDGLQPLAFAGLWSSWRPERGAEPLLTFSILTRAAAPALASLHDRMPVVLPESAYNEWLDPANDDVAALSRMIETGSVTDLRHYPVGLYVNNPKNEGPKCIEPLTTAEPAGPLPPSLPFGDDKSG
ncbi:MAG TPA: SOS response-associated peptidase [Steroidobacteraceae bacterium]|nr:SOS response-associated peptidase [Steroidobacteraceae bacterium]